MNIKSFYEIFILIAVIFKILFVIVNLRLKFVEIIDKKSEDELKKISSRAKYVDFISLMLINSLILYLFFPTNNNNKIIIGRHEQILIFAVGIIGILNLNWGLIINLFK